jgi:hypothetical protein
MVPLLAKGVRMPATTATRRSSSESAIGPQIGER